jgi:small subunit ribosomal protein S4
MKLHLKGERCFTEKCAVDRRNYAPGQHGRRKQKVQGYGLQLREKQKVKRIYGVKERQFRRLFAAADRQKGITGELLLISLERRLDNVVLKLGFASSASQARQLVSHGHVTVNGQKTDIPSYQVREGETVALKEKTRKNSFVAASLEAARSRGVPRWLELEPDQFQGKVVALPTREDVSLPIQEQLIVELYSK